MPPSPPNAPVSMLVIGLRLRSLKNEHDHSITGICSDYSDHPAEKAGLLHTGIAVSPRLEQSGKQLGQATQHVIRHDIDIHSSSYQPATVTAIDRTRAMSASMLETSTNISFELCHQLPNG
jgi:hypothetical protein